MNFQQETIAFWGKKILRHLLRGVLSKKKKLLQGVVKTFKNTYESKSLFALKLET